VGNGDPFANLKSYPFWSATSSEYYTGYAWIVHMNHGSVGLGRKSHYYHAWPVRGGEFGSFCTDTDSDGYGVCPDCGTLNSCDFDGDDCNDEDSSISPAATEIICNGIDENCNGAADDAPDSDLDGISDCTDNCYTTPNQDQVDDDGDQYGDACDNCPNTSNTDQLDTDKNGIGDACEEQDPPAAPTISEIISFFNTGIGNKTIKVKVPRYFRENYTRKQIRRFKQRRIGRMNSLLGQSQELIKNGFPEIACELLETAYLRCDGQKLAPMDWFKKADAYVLADMIQQLMTDLGCQSN